MLRRCSNIKQHHCKKSPKASCMHTSACLLPGSVIRCSYCVALSAKILNVCCQALRCGVKGRLHMTPMLQDFLQLSAQIFWHSAALQAAQIARPVIEIKVQHVTLKAFGFQKILQNFSPRHRSMFPSSAERCYSQPLVLLQATHDAMLCILQPRLKVFVGHEALHDCMMPSRMPQWERPSIWITKLSCVQHEIHLHIPYVLQGGC